MALIESTNRMDLDLAVAKALNELHANGPSSAQVVVTPSDDADIDHPEGFTATRGLAFGIPGDLKITNANGDEVTIPEGVLAAGVIHPIRVTRVHDSGTTADDIVAFY